MSFHEDSFHQPTPKHTKFRLEAQDEWNERRNDFVFVLTKYNGSKGQEAELENFFAKLNGMIEDLDNYFTNVKDDPSGRREGY